MPTPARLHSMGTPRSVGAPRDRWGCFHWGWRRLVGLVVGVGAVGGVVPAWARVEAA